MRPDGSAVIRLPISIPYAWHPRFSPDGRWLAYTSDESGRLEVYVRRFPGGEDVTRVSRNTVTLISPG